MKEKIVNRKAQAQRGYTIVELIVAVAIIMILAALAIPGYRRTVQYMRISGDMRNLNAVVAQAKMRAAADFTRARAYADLAANTYHLEVWNKTGNGGAGCWQTDGDTAHACTAGTSPALPLSIDVSSVLAASAQGVRIPRRRSSKRLPAKTAVAEISPARPALFSIPAVFQSIQRRTPPFREQGTPSTSPIHGPCGG